ncbi:MAG: LicD family protein [Oscillospiraceae bacterium]|nr:LicD family protein [Oscillospiraceae bacterium]
MKLHLQEIQKAEWNILKAFHEYCQARGLRYALSFGTLLGAVRHGGFIPWDNDIDVMMPRSDFEQFLACTKAEPVADTLYVQHYTLDPRYHYICARVCDANTHVHVPYIRQQPSRLGVWIDIFPVDGVGEGSPRFPLQQALLKWHWMLFRADVYGSTEKNSRTRLNYLIKKAALVLFPNRNHAQNYAVDRICKWFPFEEAENVAFLFGEEGICKIPRRDFDELIKLPFGDGEFYCPPHYDQFLTQSYGDYMTLPKEEDRMTHDIDAEYLPGETPEARKE